MAAKCESSKYYVPKSTDNITQIIGKIEVDHLEQPIRIWTDYKRVNETHFWSNTAEHWWSLIENQDDNNYNLFLQFKDSVLVDGYGKLKNFRPPVTSCCICVVNQELKSPLKFLLIMFIASFIYVIVGVTIRLREE